ncbi:MAG: hypothetical protein NC203_06565 [Firmicutes bacterium]|nr:hypothetical protein [Bacillota bacterium]
MKVDAIVNAADPVYNSKRRNATHCSAYTKSLSQALYRKHRREQSEKI